MVKIERTLTPPKSLADEAKKANGSYSEPDVIKQLREDFHDKCYICEMSELQDAEVEHLLPHMNGAYPDRKFDWNNLFWSCGHCNKVKNKRKYDVGIIDCCVSDPEERMYFRLQEGEVVVLAKAESDQQAVLTSELVTEVFNQKNTGMREYKSEMRLQKLTKEMNKFYDAAEEWKENPKSRVASRKLKALLRRESPFAAFKRNYVRENSNEFSGLLSYIA